MKKTNNLLWGIILILIGIIYALNAFNIVNIDILFAGWWTLFIIIPGLINLLNNDDKIGAIITIVVGIFLLLACQELINLELLINLLIPTILILIGINLLIKSKGISSTKALAKELSSKATIIKAYQATLTGMNIKLDDASVEAYKLDAIIGNLNADLTKNKLKKNLLITTCSIFGSITLVIPSDVDVKIISTPILGKVLDQRREKDKAKDKAIYLNATIFFGTIKLKTK